MNTKGRASERGMAALMVTTILMLVITLIIVGFSQVSRRNQKDTLDRQLSSQALYAAESGVNAASAIVRNNVANSLEILGKTTCEGNVDYPDIKLSGDEVKVTCLLVEPRVPDLVFDGVSENSPTVIAVTPVTGVVDRVFITWRPSGSTTNANFGCPTVSAPSYTLPVRASWACGHGILRLDMIGIPNGADSQQAKTVFLYPHTQSANVTTANAPVINANDPSGGLVTAYCSDNGDPKCMVTITLSPVSEFYINARSLYKNSKLLVDGADPSGTSQTYDSQVKLDVTAKAVDVLKRIQVRVPIKEKINNSVPAYGIETSESLCKRFSVSTGRYYADPVAGCPLP